MSRVVTAMLAVGLFAASAMPAQAQWLHGCIENMKRDFRRNNDWPYPFVNADREAVALPFGAMVANGWRRQNLLQEHHFDDGVRLNKAGEVKVRWILTQQQPQRRVLFVQRGVTQDITAARVTAVRQMAIATAPVGELADVVESNLAPEGWPADEIDRVYTMFQTSQPSPRIPSSGGGGGSSGGDSGSGSSGGNGGGSSGGGS